MVIFTGNFNKSVNRSYQATVVNSIY